MMQKKQFLVTANVDPKLVEMFGEGSDCSAIASLIQESLFVHVISVEEATMSHETKSNNEGNN